MNFQTAITNILASTPDSAELLQSLSEYDTANNTKRLKQALNDYLINTPTSKEDATTINDAIGSLN